MSKKDIKDKVKDSRWYQQLIFKLKSIKIKSLNDYSLYDLIKYYMEGIKSDQISLRSSSITISILMSLIPFGYLLLSFIPSLPDSTLANGLNDQLLSLFFSNQWIAENDHLMTEKPVTIGVNSGTDIISQVISFFVFLWAASRGITSILKQFTKINHREKENFIIKNLIRIGLAIWFTILFLFEIWVLMEVNHYANIQKWNPILINTVDLMIIGILFYVSMLSLYTFGAPIPNSLKGVKPGAVLSTFCFVLSSFGFKLVIELFLWNNFNHLYGVFAILFIFIIWIRLIVKIMLLGNELNKIVWEMKNGEIT